MSKRTMQEIVSEHNKLAGSCVGEKRLAALKNGLAVKPTKPTTGHKQRITVDGVPHRSVASAFAALSLPMSRHIKFRAMLKAQGEAIFEHGDKHYKFAVIKES